MAGVGIRLNKIFRKGSILTDIIGFSYCIVITIAPMLLVILTIFLMMKLDGFSNVQYATRELFASTLLYIFIFSLITAAPFNSVLSKYMSDIIYEEKYADILPCFYAGLLLNIIFSCIFAIPFCIWEYIVGQVDIIYVFTGFCGYIAMVLVFYTTLYMSICKDYSRLTKFYLIGMLIALIISLLLVYIFSCETTYSILLSLTIGFYIIASMGLAIIHSYFRENSHQYKRLFHYFRIYWKLILTNFLYIMGLFVHNFVFWTTDIKIVVAKSFICAEPYDMASCLAMFTNISASVIFISRIEMNFHGCYKAYSEAVIGGRWSDIEKAKGRMFRHLSSELMSLTRIQFIISVIMFLFFTVVLPQIGFSGMVMRIYPSLAAAYFVVFLMYAALIFIFYYDDLNGALMTAFGFFLVTLLGSIYATRLSDIWYGAGLFAGALTGWCIAYCRLRWIERNLDTHIFCRGELLNKGRGKKPPEKVYDAYFGLKRRKRPKRKEEFV